MARRLTATTAEELYAIEGLIHDAYCDEAAIAFDAAAGTLVVPFAQEEVDWQGEPPWEHLRSTWLYEEYRVPFMAGRLTIHHVKGVEGGDDWRDGPCQLVSIRHDARRGRVTLNAWSDMHVSVERLEVEAEHGEEVARSIRRRTYRFLNAESDRPL